jgi:hypothetical protein
MRRLKPRGVSQARLNASWRSATSLLSIRAGPTANRLVSWRRFWWTRHPERPGPLSRALGRPFQIHYAGCDCSLRLDLPSSSTRDPSLQPLLDGSEVDLEFREDCLPDCDAKKAVGDGCGGELEESLGLDVPITLQKSPAPLLRERIIAREVFGTGQTLRVQN